MILKKVPQISTLIWYFSVLIWGILFLTSLYGHHVALVYSCMLQMSLNWEQFLCTFLFQFYFSVFLSISAFSNPTNNFFVILLFCKPIFWRRFFSNFNFQQFFISVFQKAPWCLSFLVFRYKILSVIVLINK